MIAESQTQALVTLPPQLWADAQRIAGEHNWSIDEAIVFLAKVGAASQRKAEANLQARYREFMDETDPEKQSQAGDEMIRAIFGPDSVAQD
ncbi:MAG: hypothetical protein WB992_11370 [Bryobacteraceae bacterium]